VTHYKEKTVQIRQIGVTAKEARLSNSFSVYCNCCNECCSIYNAGSAKLSIG
jgi:hypothetical protein